MEINKEKKLHERWYKQEDPVSYQWYLNGSPEFMQDFELSEKSWLAAKATPEGFVLVPKVITDEWMSVYVDPEVSKYCKEFEGLPFAVSEKDLPMIQEDFRRPIKAAHSRLMMVIEAQEQSHENS